MEFSVRCMKRMIRRKGDKRISKPAAERLGVWLESWCEAIAEQAREKAQEENRSTIKGKDIQFALPEEPPG